MSEAGFLGMRKTPVSLPLALLAAWAGMAGPLAAQSAFANWRSVVDPVAVASTSTAEYQRQKFGPGAPKPETYLFFQGKYYGGTTRDPNLEKAQFDQIVKIVAENMVHQNYFPSKDVKNADLLIVVHWGVTTTDVEPNYADDRAQLANMSAQYDVALQRYLSGKGKGSPPDPGPVQAQLALVDGEEATIMKQIAINAQLLGFKGQISKDQALGTADLTGVSTEERELIESLNEERYLVILMAYDYHTMKKGSTPKLLWSTRFSIRAPGNTFTAALPVMSKAAADYFGRAIDGLKTVKPDLAPEGRVEVGAPTVVGDGKNK
jgi:hypothetical protein